MPDIFPEVRKMTDSLLTIPFDEDDKINEAEKFGSFDLPSMCLFFTFVTTQPIQLTILRNKLVYQIIHSFVLRKYGMPIAIRSGC